MKTDNLDSDNAKNALDYLLRNHKISEELLEEALNNGPVCLQDAADLLHTIVCTEHDSEEGGPCRYYIDSSWSSLARKYWLDEVRSLQSQLRCSDRQILEYIREAVAYYRDHVQTHQEAFYILAYILERRPLEIPYFDNRNKQNNIGDSE